MTAAQDHARSQIQTLVKLYNRLDKAQKEGLQEDTLIHQFIDPLFKALGWPIGDPNYFEYEKHTVAGRPDMKLTTEKGTTIYIEAKRFGLIKPLARAKATLDSVVTPGEMTLSGMATDRTPEEQQAINYAFQNNSPWAILTNFERLRLFNARRDWLVVSFESPDAYLDEFDLLWKLSYEQLEAGGLEELSDQRHRDDVDQAYLSFINEWRERLAQDIVANREKNPWAFEPDGRIRVAELRAVVQRILDRLVVVRYAEDHQVIRPGTLNSLRELRKTTPYTFSLSEFYARLYRVFDDKHNSGLFALGLPDEAVISDDVLAGLTEKLYQARYRSMPADIMGNTYEEFLGKALVQSGGTVFTASNLETRKKQGSYYTPQVIVRYLIDNSLGRYLYGTANGKPDGEPLPDETRKTASDIRGLRVIDPACGSGSFLIYAYQVLADFYREEIERITAERGARYDELVRGGIITPFELQVQLTPWRAELDRLHEYPTLILENHLYGVDLDPQAAEIATVNLIMRAMADMPGKDRRLPLILNQNVKVGNSLIGAGPADPRYSEHAEALAEIRGLRVELAAETENAPEAETVARIGELAAGVNAALDQSLLAMLGDLERHRPLNWAVEFPEVFLDETGHLLGEKGGFDVVVGNPPWEVVKPDKKEFYSQFDPLIESKLSAKQVSARITELDEADPLTRIAWDAQKQRIEEQLLYFKKAREFKYQGQGDRATHKLFIERGYDILGNAGRLAYIVPAGIYADVGTKELRLLLLREGRIEYLYGFSNERRFFKDVHHGFKFALMGLQRGATGSGFKATFRINTRDAITLSEMPLFLANPGNFYYYPLESLRVFDPANLTAMELSSQTDYGIATRIYGVGPILGESETVPWSPDFGQEFHMAADSDIFRETNDGFPLYEGKMIHQWDAYFAPPRYWIRGEDGLTRLGKAKVTQWHKSYRLAFREVSGAVNERTSIAAILPPLSFAGHTLWLGMASDLRYLLYLAAILNSLVADWVIRLKANLHVTRAIVEQLPVPRLTSESPFFELCTLKFHS